MEQLVKGVAAVPGVTAIENRLESHRGAGHVSALQGPGPLKRGRMPASWRRWPPSARFAAGAIGLALLALPAPNRPLRTAAGVAGVELLERALLGPQHGA